MSQYKSEQILRFLDNCQYDQYLGQDIETLNPYRDSKLIRNICTKFYTKFYADTKDRFLILGINPGRLGAGATGIPFTDTKRLYSHCNISIESFSTHEPSSVFIYDLISAVGGPQNFYNQVYINSVYPLALIKKHKGKELNYNYYDDKFIAAQLTPFIIQNIQYQQRIAGIKDIIFCLGNGKNYHFLAKLNQQYQFTKSIIPLEHPRYIMQYKSSSKEKYLSLYMSALKSAGFIFP